MKKLFLLLALFALTFVSCEMSLGEKSVDQQQQKQTERQLSEANKQLGMPAIQNFTEKKQLKRIYELRDQEGSIMHAYLVNEINGEIGQYLGVCIGYGIPYSTQFSNPEKLVDVTDYGISSYQSNDSQIIQQAEPNGLFTPTGMSATWLELVDPKTNTSHIVYVEPAIIVSPFKLH